MSLTLKTIIVTTVPDPLFMENVGTAFIISKKTAEKATNADFNNGKAAIGTGAYKFVSWAPGDRIQLDREITQAMGQFLARGGIKVNKVETLPYSVYSKDALKGAYGMFIFSYGNSTGEASRGMESLFHSADKDRDLGSLNRTLYSNPAFDKAIEQAIQEFDPKKREKMLQDADTMINNDAAFIPLYWQSLAWATRNGINFKARRDERTLAISASIAK